MRERHAEREKDGQRLRGGAQQRWGGERNRNGGVEEISQKTGRGGEKQKENKKTKDLRRARTMPIVQPLSVRRPCCKQTEQNPH